MNIRQSDETYADVPDVTLERYRLGELARDTVRRLEERRRTDDVLRTRLDAIARSDDELRAEGFPEALARQVRTRVGVRAGRRAGPTAIQWLAPTAVTAMLLAAIQLSPWPAGDDARIKGADASLFVYRSTPASAELLKDRDLASAGDIVRLGYRVAAPVFGAIVSVDGRGVLTTHLPDSGSTAPLLQPGATVLLGSAYELDDAPRIERFFLVTAAQPFDLRPVRDAVHRASGPEPFDRTLFPLPPTFTVTAISLLKDEHP